MNAPHIDTSRPSLLAARQLAHQECLAHGPEAAKSLMARLLMHVDVEEGGLLGADDMRAASVRRQFGISVDQYMEALYSAGPWPVAKAAA